MDSSIIPTEKTPLQLIDSTGEIRVSMSPDTNDEPPAYPTLNLFADCNNRPLLNAAQYLGIGAFLAGGMGALANSQPHSGVILVIISYVLLFITIYSKTGPDY